MDRVTQNLIEDFLKLQQLTSKNESTDFEHFSNYAVVASEYSDDFEIESVNVGEDGTPGIDGIAIIVNGYLIESQEEIEDLMEANNYVDATFIFIQSKTSNSFDGSQIGNFCFAVKNLFIGNKKLVQNEVIDKKVQLIDYIFDKSEFMKNRNPVCKLFYVTTGRWTDDQNLVAVVENARSELEATSLFQRVIFTPLGATEIQRLYQSSKGRVSATINFVNKVTLPDLDGVSQSYIGFLPLTEYWRLIVDDVGNIRRSLFNDNVRDFQGSNEVNKEIASTLESEDINRFIILNNGITIVSKSITAVGNRFTLVDFQIVNGCQTSHVLYNTLYNNNDKASQVQVPIKIVSTTNEDVTNSVIKSTNSQTAIKPEELEALSTFQKKLEIYYQSYELPQKLYYERRSRQYSNEPVEKVRIVNIGTQIKVFASMFLDRPHTAGRHPRTLLQQINQNIFREDHQPISYYTSAFAYYDLLYFFRNGSLDAKYSRFKYTLLMILRHQVAGKNIPQFNSKKIQDYCDGLLTVLWNQDEAIKTFKEAINVIEEVGTWNMDDIRTQEYTNEILKRL
jgi:hypothetical protein